MSTSTITVVNPAEAMATTGAIARMDQLEARLLTLEQGAVLTDGISAVLTDVENELGDIGVRLAKLESSAGEKKLGMGKWADLQSWVGELSAQWRGHEGRLVNLEAFMKRESDKAARRR